MFVNRDGSDENLIFNLNRKRFVELLMIFACLAVESHALTIECQFAIEDWINLNDVYGCTLESVITEPGDRWDAITKVEGEHLEGKKNEDVETLNIDNAIFHSIPRNFEFFFPNLKGLRIVHAKIRTLESDDFRAFPSLKVLCLWGNELTTLDSDIFTNTPDLEVINFGANYIKHIGPNFFEPLTKLTTAFFDENPCINHTKPNDIASLKFETAVKCPPLFTQVEIALLNGKLATKNDELEKKIVLLENRINELEMQAKK
jgi:hypothetical protein